MDRVKIICKRICKRTTQHSMARGTTSRDYRMRKAKLEHTDSYSTAQASMRMLELENRCTDNRTVGSNPTLSANIPLESAKNLPIRKVPAGVPTIGAELRGASCT